MDRTTTATLCLLMTTPLSAQWQALTPATTPSARAGHGMAIDSIGTALLFGGQGGMALSNQTWQFDGIDWTLLTPPNSPTARFGVQLIFNSNRGSFVTYGGATSALTSVPLSNQTWEFDGATWTQLAPTASPPGLAHYGLAYDLIRDRTVLYGGSSSLASPSAQAGTWEFDGVTWTPVTNAAQPGPLDRPALCFDPTYNRTLLFGGVDPSTGGVDTLWSYDGTRWTVVAPATTARPSPRYGARLAHDPSRGSCLLHGGLHATTGAVLADTWEWNGTAWELLPATTLAAPGRDFGMVFDPTRRRTVRFGGASIVANNVTAAHGAFEAEFGTGCPGSNGVPRVTALGAPHLGSTYTLQLTHLNAWFPFAIAVLGLGAPGALPLDAIGMPGCVGYTNLDLLVSVPTALGAGTWSGVMPNTTGLVGTELYAQALSIDPGTNSAGLVSSNGHRGVLGL